MDDEFSFQYYIISIDQGLRTVRLSITQPRQENDHWHCQAFLYLDDELVESHEQESSTNLGALINSIAAIRLQLEWTLSRHGSPIFATIEAAEQGGPHFPLDYLFADRTLHDAHIPRNPEQY